MKQEDLKNLKIEDLEEVTEGYWVDGEEMLVSDGGVLHLCDVIAVNQNIKGSYKAMSTTGNFKKAYKIPKPQTREMESSEIKGYLHDLNKNDYIECALQGDPWQHYTYFSRPSINYSFRKIDKNGKVTEFKIPQIEV